MVKRINKLSGSGGVCSVLVGQGYSSLGGLQSTIIPNTNATFPYVVGFTNAATATSTNVFNGGVSFTLDGWSGATPMIPDLVDNVRLVSAGLAMKWDGSASSNSLTAGTFTAAFLPRDYVRSNLSSMSLTTMSYDTVTHLPGSITVPIFPVAQDVDEDSSGVSVTYVPVDEDCNTFVDTGVDAVVLDRDTQQLWNPGALLIVASGGSANTAFSIQIVLNYEGIASKNSLLIENATSRAIDDPIARSQAIAEINTYGGARLGSKGFGGISANSGYTHPLVSYAFGLNANCEDVEDGMVIHSKPFDASKALTIGINGGYGSSSALGASDQDSRVSMYRQLGNIVAAVQQCIKDRRT
jgi:hypothetical protein